MGDLDSTAEGFLFDANAAANLADAGHPAEEACTEDAQADLRAVRERLLELDPEGKHFASTLRDTIDQLLDGERTGRYDWADLMKTERTHAGTLVEINLQREFQFSDGSLDYQIAGVEVDCKYSQKPYSWMFPPESVGHICLVVSADDYKSRWSAGLLHVDAAILNRPNRDEKRTLKAACRDEIHWLWKDAALPENVLLHMTPADREAVFEPKSGQKRLNELFRRVQQRRIHRNIIRTVAQQKDPLKRARGNGGARSALRPEGILVIGDYDKHREVARSLKVPVPEEGEFVSVRVIAATDEHTNRPSVNLDDQTWVRAEPGDPYETGPMLPDHKRTKDTE